MHHLTEAVHHLRHVTGVLHHPLLEENSIVMGVHLLLHVTMEVIVDITIVGVAAIIIVNVTVLEVLLVVTEAAEGAGTKRISK